MYYVAELCATVEVPLSEAMGCVSEEERDQQLLSRLVDEFDGRYSAQHGCHVLAVLRVDRVDAESGGGVITLGSRRMHDQGLTHRVVLEPQCALRARFVAAACRVREGEVLDARVEAVRPAVLVLAAGPVRLHVRRVTTGAYRHEFEAGAWLPRGERASERWRWRRPALARQPSAPEPAGAAEDDDDDAIRAGTVLRVHVDSVERMEGGFVCWASIVARRRFLDVDGVRLM